MRTRSLALVLLVACVSGVLIDPARAAPSVVTPSPDPAHEILSAPFQRETDIRSASRLTAGNGLALLENGATSAPVKRSLAATARRTLFVTTMNWSYDGTGRGFAEDLIAARRRGVEVRAIVDAVFADPRIVWRLQAGGVRVLRFNGIVSPGSDRRGRIHWKMVVADLDRAVVGGMNIADEFWLGDGRNGWFHDTDALVAGGAAVEAARAFLRLWLELDRGDPGATALLADPVFARPPAPAGAPAAARFITHEPDRRLEHLTDYYARCIRAARRQVLWHVNVFDPVEPLATELEGAAARGVRVVIVLESGDSFRRRFGAAYVAYFKVLATFARMRLAGTGIELYELDQPIHSKAFTVDGVLASVGSFNFHRTAVKLNLECSLVAHDPAFVRAVEEMFDRDIGRARRLL